MAMLRHHHAQDSTVDARLLLSARAWDDVLYRDELAAIGENAVVQAHYTLTRGQPEDWTGFRGRVDAAMLTEVGPTPDERPRIYVCGPTAFVEHTADLLIDLGHPPQAIRAERFGPTGG
jgi:ferredoxin-NADP reductase